MCRLLIVEDDLDLRTALVDVLSEAGFDCLPAPDGPTALELLRVRDAASQPEAALIDFGLPLMDGRELAQILRRAQPDMFLVALTGWMMDRTTMVCSGVFNRIIAKPIDVDVLLSVLMTRDSESLVQSEPPGPPPGPTK